MLEHISAVNRLFVINYIAQWQILDLLYIIYFFFICSLVSIFCYFSIKLTAPCHNSKNDNSCWTSKWNNILLISGNKTDRHDETKILLKVALNTIILTPKQSPIVTNLHDKGWRASLEHPQRIQFNSSF
jgi:hypothetical protein